MLDHPQARPLGLAEMRSGEESLDSQRCLELYQLMVRTRALEERMIQMAKTGESYFWVGGPGEEALNVPLGRQVRKGQGPKFDYLHLHYRASGTLLAMGMPMLDAVRQAASRLTDPHSMGRNFVGHYARPEWNVLPVTSVIEIQFSMAVGTALMQKRSGHRGVTIVTGGDAGSAEADFASCLGWSTRPGNEVPVLMIVANNHWGISTASATQQLEQQITCRAEAFGIPAESVDGNDPIASWHAIRRGMRYCRRHRRPYLIEARVSRLHGHSSASGAERVSGEPDCVQQFEQKLIETRLLDDEQVRRHRQTAHREADQAARQALREPQPTAADRLRHTYAASPVDAVYPDDYTGLPD